MAADKPNIVWLLTDHHVYAHHMRGAVAGPTLATHDRIAARGVSFRQAYSVCPLCTPARASMLTGVYPHRHGMVMNNGDCGSRLDFEPDERLFSHYLREAGYRVGYFGKWHCGDVRGPSDYGFEGWSMLGYGHAYWTDAYAEYLRELGLPTATVDIEWHFHDPSRVTRGLRLADEPDWFRMMESSGVLTTPVATHEAYFVSHLAERWLERVAGGGDPFCLRVDVWGPHQPYYVAPPFAGSIDPRQIPEYPTFSHTLADRPASHRRFRDRLHESATIHSWDQWQPVVARCYEHATQVDAALGRVVAALERLGLAEDTLVIYTADHGDAIAAAGGVFDKDSLMIEETSRIPLAMRWDGRTPRGAVLDHLASNMDVVPTILAAAGAQCPSPMDGRSLLGPARDGAEADWDEELMCQHHGHGSPHFQRLLRYGPYKYVAHLDEEDELYDLSRDPCEQENLAPQESMRGVLADMQRRLAGQMDRCDDDAEDAGRLKRAFL